jgi:ribonuclease P protein component
MEADHLIVALKRAFRLRKSSEFQRVRQQGRSLASRLLILAFLPGETAHIRVGFVVSKRISKHAVVRNSIKRLMSEAIRVYLADIPGGWDIIFSARNAILTANLQTLKQDMNTVLQRAKLLAPPRAVEPGC